MKTVVLIIILLTLISCIAVCLIGSYGGVIYPQHPEYFYSTIIAVVFCLIIALPGVLL